MPKPLFAVLVLVMIGLAANPLGCAAYHGTLLQGVGALQANRVLAPLSPVERQPGTGGTAAPLAPEVALAYANAVRQICLETSAEDSTDLTIIYLVRATDPNLGTPNQPQPAQYLPASWQSSISSALSDLPMSFVWVDSATEATVHPNGAGAIITFGNASREDSNGWTGVPVSLSSLR